MNLSLTINAYDAADTTTDEQIRINESKTKSNPEAAYQSCLDSLCLNPIGLKIDSCNENERQLLAFSVVGLWPVSPGSTRLAPATRAEDTQMLFDIKEATAIRDFLSIYINNFQTDK